MNDYVKGLGTYPKTLQDAFALLTKTRCRSVTKFIFEGSSFSQGQGEGEGNAPACWGCQEECVFLGECIKRACMERWRKKQEKRAANAVQLAQGGVNWDEAEEFELF